MTETELLQQLIHEQHAIRQLLGGIYQAVGLLAGIVSIGFAILQYKGRGI